MRVLLLTMRSNFYLREDEQAMQDSKTKTEVREIAY